MANSYYDPVGRSLRSILTISVVCLVAAVGCFLLDIVSPGSVGDPGRPFADASVLLFSFGLATLVVFFAVQAIVGALRSRG